MQFLLHNLFLIYGGFMNRFLIITFVVLTISGCSKVRESHFMSDLCQPQSEYDQQVCECTFDVLDDELTGSIGQTWVFKPDLARYPQFSKAMDKADKKCSPHYGF